MRKPKKFTNQVDNSIRKIVARNNYVYKNGDFITIKDGDNLIDGILMNGVVESPIGNYVINKETEIL